MSPALLAWAERLHVARGGGPVVDPRPGLTLTEAYAVAGQLHARRVAAGDAPVGRKIGHTNPANWPHQGITAPSWGWLYASTTWQGQPLPSASDWREPKVELELVLHLRQTPPAQADAVTLAKCIDAVALGLEFVDRPYPAWGGSVADSVAAGGVHAGLWIGEAHPCTAGVLSALSQLSATLAVGDLQSAGGSGLVLGNPLTALLQLQALLEQQGAPGLQAGEWITTGALAPALPYAPGAAVTARIAGPGLSLAL